MICSTSWPAPASASPKLVGRLPGVHVAHEEVGPPGSRRAWSCARWSSSAQGREVVLVDGVKVLEADGWALVLPDPEEPVTHVWAEAPSERRGPSTGPGVRHPHPPDDALSRARRLESPWSGAEGPVR